MTTPKADLYRCLCQFFTRRAHIWLSLAIPYNFRINFGKCHLPPLLRSLRPRWRQRSLIDYTQHFTLDIGRGPRKTHYPALLGIANRMNIAGYDKSKCCIAGYGQSGLFGCAFRDKNQAPHNRIVLWAVLQYDTPPQCRIVALYPELLKEPTPPLCLWSRGGRESERGETRHSRTANSQGLEMQSEKKPGKPRFFCYWPAGLCTVQEFGREK